MRLRSLLRDLVLVCLALAIGWWCRGAGTPVLAQRSGSGSSHDGDESTLAFQLSPMNRDTTLTIYNSTNHTLYVYPIQTGNSHINCEFSFRIGKPGAAIDRQNCPIGEALPSY